MSGILKKKVWYIHSFVEVNTDPMVDLGIHIEWCNKIGVDIKRVIIGKKVNHSYFEGRIDADKVHNILYHQIESERPILRKPFNFVIRLLNTFKIIYLLKKRRFYDLTAFFVSYDPIFFILIALLCKNLDYILFAHFTPLIKNRIFRKMNFYCLSRARKIFVVEEEVKRELCRQFGDLERKIVVVEKLTFDSKPLIIHSKRRGAKTRFLFPGAIRVAKGILIYLKAIKDLNGYEGMEILLAGAIEENNKSMINNEILKSQELLGGSFKFIEEHLSNDRYYESLKEADYLVLPYLKKFYVGRASSVIYDAIKVGTPIIAPDFGMFKDYINRFGIGLFFKAEDPVSLAKVMLHASKSNLSFEEGFVKAYQEFSSERFRENFTKVFASI